MLTRMARLLTRMARMLTRMTRCVDCSVDFVKTTSFRCWFGQQLNPLMHC